MNQADIYIHASLHEPFGIPPLDAMIRGKCVIVSNEVQSTNSLIENGINGYKYPALSAEKLAELLKNIDIEKMYEIGLNAQKSVAQKYSYQIYLDALHGICPN